MAPKMLKPPQATQGRGEVKTSPKSALTQKDRDDAGSYTASANDIPQLRNSERHDFKRCPLRWHWRYREQLVPVSFTSGPLLFGSLGHLALAEHYIPGTKRGENPQETWERLTRELWDAVKVSGYVDDEVEGTWEDARTLGHTMLGNYLGHYGNDEHWEVLWVEDQFHQRIPHPIDLRAKAAKPRAIVEYVGTIDLIVRNHETGLIEYVDHKFMKSIETDHLYIDDQNGGYLAIGTHELRKRGTIGPKESVRVLVYNFLRKAVPPDRPKDANGKYTNLPTKEHYVAAIHNKIRSLNLSAANRGDFGAKMEALDDVASMKMKLDDLRSVADRLKITVIGEASKSQPPPFFHRERIERTRAEANKQVERIGQEALVMQQFRTGRLPIYKTPTRDCKWDCSFFDLCSIHESGGNVDFAKEQMFRREDPYGEYESGALSPKLLRDR